MKKENKKHRGNYAIGVSFDLYGKSSVMEPEAFVWCLENAMKKVAKEWFKVCKTGVHKFEVKNVKWEK